MKTLIDYLFWHYTKAVQNILKIWLNYLIFLYHYFSIDLLSSTLFKPWKREYLVKAKPYFSFEEWVTRFTFNLFSRLIGTCVRTTAIIIWFLVECLAIFAGLIIIPLWVLMPFLSFFVYWLSLEKNINRKKQQALQKFLKLRTLDKKDIALVTEWFERNWQRIQKQARFWELDNLFKISGLGKDWAYGFTPQLDKFSEDLTKPRSYSHHLVGREKEVIQIEQVLTRSAENNALLIGESGVGKKTMILGFAKKVKEGKISPALRRKRVLELNLTALLGETTDEHKARDELDKLLKEAKQAGNIILIIFDFDKYIAADAGRVNLTRSFIPHLSGNQIQIVGVATPFAFQKYIFKNPDILKFFEKIEVDQPTQKEALVILEEILPQFEKNTGVTVSFKALKNIIELSDKLITHIPFPEKAIDLLDETTIFARRQNIKVILPEHVHTVLTQKTKIPIGEISDQEKQKLINLEKLIHQTVINQEEAVSSLAKALRRSRMEISQKSRPIGSFLFLGPTGVGKTQTAKALSKTYFGNENIMNRIDFSEFQTKEDIVRLIGDFDLGSPGILSAKIRENPFAVLLLDEIEKAHPKILNLFLQVLDEGYFTDAFGKQVSCKNLIIIATSNAGAEFIRTKVNEGITDKKLTTKLINYIQEKHIFSPELINRFDGLIVFKPLTKENLKDIACLLLNNLNKRLLKKEITLKLTPELIERVAELGFDPAFGARPMRRVIQDKVEAQIAKDLLEGKIKKGQTIEVKI